MRCRDAHVCFKKAWRAICLGHFLLVVSFIHRQDVNDSKLISRTVIICVMRNNRVQINSMHTTAM